MTVPGSHQNFCLHAHECAELCVQPFKWMRSTKLFRFHGQMQSPKQPQSPCICSRAFMLSYVMKWQNSSHLYRAQFSKRAREPVLRKWCDPEPQLMPSWRQRDQTLDQLRQGLIRPAEKHNNQPLSKIVREQSIIFIFAGRGPRHQHGCWTTIWCHQQNHASSFGSSIPL